MITKEEFEKAVEVCTDGNMNCTQCSLGKRFYKCGVYFTRYIKRKRACTVCQQHKLRDIEKYQFNTP